MTLEQSEARCLELTNVLERVLEHFELEGEQYVVEAYGESGDTYFVMPELQEAIELAEDVLYRGVAYAEE